MTTRTSIRLIAGASLALTLPLLVGCQAFNINEEYGASYATLGDMEESWDSARIPNLVPSDAEDLHIAYNTIDKGAMLGFTSKAGITADYCEQGAVDGEPAFEPDWWPTGELPTEGFTCGDWTVVEVDGEFIVWD
jgi:hypothetical protein